MPIRYRYHPVSGHSAAGTPVTILNISKLVSSTNILYYHLNAMSLVVLQCQHATGGNITVLAQQLQILLLNTDFPVERLKGLPVCEGVNCPSLEEFPYIALNMSYPS